MATGTPPSGDGPRRRTDRLHGLVAGAVAVLAVLVGIFLVNLLNDPSDDDSSATSATSPTTSVTPPATTVGPPSPSEPPATSERPPTSSPATTSAPSSPSPAGTTPAADPPPATAQREFATVTIFNDSRISGLAQEAIAPVEAAGFTVDRVGNFLSVYDTPVTTVFYDPEHEAAARTMLDT
nr:LytR C-terminal domain-containing protein [Micromonospora sp. DSM 115978]